MTITKMKSLSKEAVKVLEKMRALKFEAWYIEEENYMKFSYERQDAYYEKGGTRIMIGYSYVQEGDLMSDPLIDIRCVVEDDGTANYYPVAYQLDNMGIYVEYDHETGKADRESILDDYAGLIEVTESLLISLDARDVINLETIKHYS